MDLERMQVGKARHLCRTIGPLNRNLGLTMLNHMSNQDILMASSVGEIATRFEFL